MRDIMVTHDRRECATALLYISFALLVLSFLDDGFVGNIAKILWLTSLTLLFFIDIGAGIGLCLAAIAVYNPLHYTYVMRPITYRIDDIALILMFFLLILTRLRLNVLRQDRTLIILIGLFTCLAIPSIFENINYLYFAEVARMFIIPFALLLILRNCTISYDELLSLFNAMIIIALYMSLLSILEGFHMWRLAVPAWVASPYNHALSFGNNRAGGLLMQPEFNGMALGLIYWMILADLHIRKNKFSWIKVLVCCLCLIGIFLTYTRGAWLAVIVPSLLLVTSSLSSKGPHLGWRIGIIVVILFSVGALVLYPPKTIERRVIDLKSVHYRTDIWAAAISMAKDKPLLGYGCGTFNNELINRLPPSAVGPTSSTPRIEGAHNIVLNLLAEFGIVGLLLYMSIILIMFKDTSKFAYRLYHRHGQLWIVGLCLVYFINVQFLNAHEPFTNLLFFAIMGMIAGMKNANQYEIKDV